jgi:hypothetical protein
MKCFLLPVITGATGTVTEGLKVSVNNKKISFCRFSAEEQLYW